MLVKLSDTQRPKIYVLEVIQIGVTVLTTTDCKTLFQATKAKLFAKHCSVYGNHFCANHIRLDHNVAEYHSLEQARCLLTSRIYKSIRFSCGGGGAGC